ncbi:hypothetical protein COEREDRAFT_81024 [Coemansia reversa NRRL 1564]|uniref:F-box domain-containing protein n=1 Tax=Coemansia reversa (strain ATCC 12441 / NRRL 1564) TaxID=763665 RepID=A0A2G5BCD0_COERN|nr:hypothetical protein COEREDRAFT_81024 [Coemansia reversa NRRL 1564]|eukprot:PIA16652.1 hypothetical protein COEREDRAFT_81024 [Coemansia reversa NRRL 1564]
MQLHVTSLARHLPEDIVRQIILVAVVPVLGIYKQEPVNINALLSVCRLWRTAALPIYCSCITVCSSADRQSIYWARKGLSSTKAHKLGWQGYAREAVVVASHRSVFLCELQDELRKLKDKFVKISRVRLCLVGQRTMDNMSQEPRIESTTIDPGPIFSALEDALPDIQQIKIEASNARIVHAIKAPDSQENGSNSNSGAEKCSHVPSISTYCTQTICSRIVYIDASFCPALAFAATALPNLSSLVLSISGSSLEDMLAVARQQATTLVRLEVRYIYIRDCNGIVEDHLGVPVVYSRTKMLVLDVLGAFDESELHQRTAPSGTPFPRLEHLCCTSAYPFANNVLLRGALHSLRKLVIPIDVSVAGWLLSESSKESTRPLHKYARLTGIEVRIITRTDARDSRNQAIHARILDAAFQTPQLLWLRIRYPNSQVSEYKNCISK